MSSSELKKIVSQIHDLPSLPIVANKVLHIAGDSESAVEDLVKIISSDTALATRVLRLANSAFYGFPQTISTISHTVVILGFYTVKNLVLALSVFGNFNKKPKTPLLDRKKFWEHSLACAAGSRLIAVRMGYDVPEEAFIAGLLHDIGMLVLGFYAREGFKKALSLAKGKSIPLIEAENEILGVDHYATGEWLITEWNLPPLLRNVIKYQANPLSASEILDESSLKTTAIVHVSHSISPIKFICSSEENVSVDPKILKLVNMEAADIPNIILEIEQELKKAMVFFGMEDTSGGEAPQPKGSTAPVT